MVQLGPRSGIMLHDLPGYLITEYQQMTQHKVLSLNPLKILRFHFNFTDHLLPSTKIWLEGYMDYVERHFNNTLSQLEKVMVQPIEKSKKRHKRFVFATGLAVFGLASSLFGAAFSTVNVITINSLQINVQQLQEVMSRVTEQLQSQLQLIEVKKTLKDTVTIVNLHDKLIQHTTSELKKIYETRRQESTIMEPVKRIMEDMLSELDNSISCLIQGQTPTYMVPSSIIKEVIQQVDKDTIEDVQLEVAFHMGSATPLYFDVEGMQLAFLLNLPYIKPNNVYQLKAVKNVGMWLHNHYAKVETPIVLAYHSNTPQEYFLPNLDLCLPAKDIYWLCSGKPFLKYTSKAMRGLKSGQPLEKCKLTVTKLGNNLEIIVQLVGHTWLVSTPLTQDTITFPHHVVSKDLCLMYNDSLITVPPGVIVSIGDVTLYHVEEDPLVSELTYVNVFQGQNLSIDEDLQYLLTQNDSHTVELSVGMNRSVISDYFFLGGDRAMFQPYHHLNFGLGGMIAIIIVFAGYVFYLHRHINELQQSINTFVPSRVHYAAFKDSVHLPGE